MPILFSVVASDKVVLAKFACCEGNFSEISDQVLSKISSKNEKVTYFHGHHLFHYIAENHHLYFCITDKTCQRSRAFLFLNQIRRRFGSEGKKGLRQMLADEMQRYSEDYSTIVIHDGELDELNRIGVRNSEEILGEKSLLVNNTEILNFSTISYVGKAPEKATTLNINNNKFNLNEEKIYRDIETKEKVEIPLTIYKSDMCITNNKILDTNEKSKSHVKIFVAMFLLGLAIYTLDFMPIAHLVVLVMFVIFLRFR